MKKTLLLFSALAAVSAGAALWYGGHFDGVNGSANEVNTIVPSAKTYDDFTVAGDGWFVEEVWSNNLFDGIEPSEAEVEIRSGVGPGTGGALIFSGTFPASVVATGRDGLGMDEYEVRVTGLDLYLQPGTYHLSVAPIGSGSGRSFLSTTSGDGSAGQPIGNGNSFINSEALSFDWEPTTAALGPGMWDFSMGMDGLAVVHPASFTLFRGFLVSGGLSSLFFSDDSRLVARPGFVLSTLEAPVQVILEAVSPSAAPSELRFVLEASASVTNITQMLDLFNFVSNSYEEMDSRPATTADSKVVVSVTKNASRFVEAGSGAVRARIRYRQSGPVLAFPWQARIDQAVWAVH